MKYLKTFENFNDFSSEDIRKAITSGNYIKVKFVQGISKHDQENPVKPIDISGDDITVSIDGENYSTNVKYVTNIVEDK
jgi:hypothetical protein